MRKLINSKIGVLALVLLLSVLVGMVYAAIAPRNQTYRAAAKFYTVNCGAVDADADFVVFMAPYPGYISRCWICSITGLTAADTVTNYREFSFISRGTDGTGADTLAYYTTLHKAVGYGFPKALIPDTIAMTGTTKNYMSEGEMVVFRNEEQGSATSLGNTSAFIEFIPSGATAPRGMPSAYVGTDQ